VYIVGAAGAAGSFICHKVSPFVGFSGFGKTCGSKPVHHQPFGVDGYDLKAERSFTRGSEHKNPAFFKGPGAVYKLPLVGGPRSDDVQGAALFEPVSVSAPGRRKGVSGGAEDHPVSRILLMGMDPMARQA